MRKITTIFFRLLFATITVFIINAFEPLTHINLSLNIFNILMISIFDVFGVALCIVLKFIL